MENGKCILISSCLVGLNTRYDGKNNNVDKLVQLVNDGKAIFICPEQSGGLATLRVPAEIEYGKTAADVLNGNAKVLSKDGLDVTHQFVKGAEETLKLCKKLDIKTVILKEKSPSCGSTKTYDGSFTGNKIVGHGITAELLMENGINVFSEENFPKDL